jgi:ribulose-5-phosphate 4-epimerase/fuculose-1-phosphate aldolase
MKNHGVTVVGVSVEVATLYAIFLEKAARIQLLAMASGEPSWSSDEESKMKFEQVYTPHSPSVRDHVGLFCTKGQKGCD